MGRLLLRALGLVLTLAAAVGFLAAPAWGPTQLAAACAAAASATLLLGRPGAFFLVTGMLAAQGTDPAAPDAFRRVLLPIWAALAIGGLLACAVLRRPALGRRIEHGPFGPGGV